MTEKSSDDERSLCGDADAAADFRGTTERSDDAYDDELERLLTDFYAD